MNVIAEITINTRFCKGKVKVVKTTYASRDRFQQFQTCLNLVGTGLCATSFVEPRHKLDADEVIIKNYGENEGVLNALIWAGVISEPERFERSGHVSFPVCKLLVGVDT